MARPSSTVLQLLRGVGGRKGLGLVAGGTKQQRRGCGARFVVEKARAPLLPRAPSRLSATQRRRRAAASRGRGRLLLERCEMLPMEAARRGRLLCVDRMI